LQQLFALDCNFFLLQYAHMNSKDIITKAGGTDAVAGVVGVSASSVRAMAYKPLPASWYFALCDMTGETLPPQLFSFKGLGA
jgi:hypothetical protein